MKRFINLSKQLINKAHIIGIEKAPGMFVIHTTKTQAGGWYWWGIGYWWTNENLIIIRETENKPDYEIIKKYIKDL